jgi:hypothetical protein
MTWLLVPLALGALVGATVGFKLGQGYERMRPARKDPTRKPPTRHR